MENAFKRFYTSFCFYSHDHIEILINGSGELLFFRHREREWIPTLRLLHKCEYYKFFTQCKYNICQANIRLTVGAISVDIPQLDAPSTKKTHHIEIIILYFPFSDPFLLPWEQVDKGAIRFVLSGANIMCPGLTSPGAKMTPVPKGTVVVSFKSTSTYFSTHLKEVWP